MEAKERLEKLMAKLDEKRQELKKARYNKDLMKHSEILMQITVIDKEITKLFGGIQCPKPFIP